MRLAARADGGMCTGRPELCCYLAGETAWPREALSLLRRATFHFGANATRGPHRARSGEACR
jgi:hypothetical protein